MIMTVLLLIGLCGLGLMVADSEASNLIKRLFYVDRERSLLIAASKPNSYFKMLPNFFKYTLIIPLIIFLLAILFMIIRWFVRLIQCPFCLSWWFGALFSLFYLQLPIIESILMGGVCYVLTNIIDSLIVKWK